MSKIKAGLVWLFTHEPALVFAVVAAAVGLANTKWGLHLDAAQIVTWLATALGVGVLTRQTVVSPATHEKKLGQAENIGYLQAHIEQQNPSTAPRVQPPRPPQV